jgi:hypothetical protein
VDNRRHLYLYAKHWYKRGDVISDLKKIVGSICETDAKVVDLQDILYWLEKEAYYHLGNEETGLRNFMAFLTNIHPLNCWIIGYRHKDEPFVINHPDNPYDLNIAIIHKCLSILSLTKVVDIPFELGNPDPSVLPMVEKNLPESTEIA